MLHRQFAHDGSEFVWLLKGYLTFTVKFQFGVVPMTSWVQPCPVLAALRQLKT